MDCQLCKYKFVPKFAAMRIDEYAELFKGFKGRAKIIYNNEEYTPLTCDMVSFNVCLIAKKKSLIEKYEKHNILNMKHLQKQMKHYKSLRTDVVTVYMDDGEWTEVGIIAIRYDDKDTLIFVEKAYGNDEVEPTPEGVPPSPPPPPPVRKSKYLG